jgi:translation elongation factor P/translation initiation factor 5A
MAKKQFGELKQGDKIVIFGDVLVVKKIELSEKGVKQGRTKARVEAENEKTGEEKVIIRLAKEEVEVK